MRKNNEIFFGKIIKDYISGYILITKNGVDTALCSYGDDKEEVKNYWEKKIGKYYNYKFSDQKINRYYKAIILN